MNSIRQNFERPGRVVICGAPEGYDARILAEIAGRGEAARDVLFVARDDVRLARMAEALAFFAPEVEVVALPAWDCLPYDRVSPRSEIVSRRIDALARLAGPGPGARARVILSSVSAVLQRVPPREVFRDAARRIAVGERIAIEDLVALLGRYGYSRSGTVMEPGEFAVRGGILDLFPPGRDEPVRLDYFGDEVEGLRTFDATSQRTIGEAEAVTLRPVSEVLLTDEAISRFRSGYRALFGAVGGDDPLYEAVSAGRRHLGLEHWLALFYERLESVFDYVPEAAVVLDHRAEEARSARIDLINEYYEARLGLAGAFGAPPYNPVPPARLYLTEGAWPDLLVDFPVGLLSPFDKPDTGAGERFLDAGGRPGRDFGDIRVRPGANVFDAVRDYVRERRRAGDRVVVAAYSEGARDRLRGVLAEHGLDDLVAVAGWAEALERAPVALAVVGLDRGFRSPGMTVISEQDILGDRLRRPARRKIRAENFIAEASSLQTGDLVVHVDHGIGRYEGLVTVEVDGAPHDCLRLIYDGGDKLFLPVENIELISRYGSEATGVALDRLGGAAWQSRKARLKKRIRDMAEALIRLAAARALKPAAAMEPPAGLYEEFCARFPYGETEDQQRAIDDTVADLADGRPTDRLVCGDVGFGKTEVALRAAFVAALSGRQVAVVVPTTLLSGQHFRTFTERFADYPVRIEQLSRLVPAQRAREVKQGLARGTVDIVIGTHALLANDIRFRDLGLVVVDEEQHFGVAHKEKLKRLKADVHVITLTATPIPRTLQLALAGVRDMSLIATPPVDRLAVRTFILPYDPVVVREAIRREHDRGGQIFYVCPRIADLDRVEGELRELVPEIKMVTAHGRMAPRRLEQAMATFYEGACDLLLSTNIIESGLDLPAVNTIVIHRADRFGLAQLYQLRGRVGRAKVRAYAYLTVPPGQALSAAAEKRLEVMQTLDSLGAGFTLASHDLDIRGAGNLLGAEQSGHIREVGIELYQHMLEEAVAEARGLAGGRGDEDWSPQIHAGLAVMIPEAYVADLAVRMGLYRRMAGLSGRGEIDAFAAELIDRFGPLPEEVENLIQTLVIKGLCRDAGVERVEAGPKGAVVSFRDRRFANPAGLVDFITAHARWAKLRPDHKLVYRRDWEAAEDRLVGVRQLVGELARIARADGARERAADAASG